MNKYTMCEGMVANQKIGNMITDIQIARGESDSISMQKLAREFGAQRAQQVHQERVMNNGAVQNNGAGMNM